MRKRERLGRRLVWFSCGAASAITAKIATDKYGGLCDVLYCDTFAYEHPDNYRFFVEVQEWINKRIIILASEKYKDIYDVYEKTGWLIGPAGARCTTELKKNVRREHEKPFDVHLFGFTYDEKHRIDRFYKENPDLLAEFPLYNNKITKKDCYIMLQEANIELPTMYKLGYKNNNCIGCVKGGAGYWNKIKRDFPEYFWKMAALERKMGIAINKKMVDGKRIKIFLDELPENMGRYNSEPDIECGVLCIHGNDE